MIDQKIMGTGSRVVDTGRIETFRLQGVSEGIPVPRVMGRMRIAGQLIWSSKFRENVSTTTGGGGKATGSPKVTTNKYSYSISIAFAIGEGVVGKVGRVWADGQEIARESVSMAFYPGNEVQNPDPTIAAIEGIENAPSYRGTSYVVFEELDLEPFGNRIPQFNFEVFRKAQPEHFTVDDPAQDVQGVCLIPGTGEYSLATTPVHYAGEFGDGHTANVNTGRGDADIVHALDDLALDLPNATSVSLVVSWFGDNLRCGDCQVQPKVEQLGVDGTPVPWEVSGIGRGAAALVSRIDDRPVFGGTPSDASVLEGIQAIKNNGQSVVFYPFILMDVQVGNGLGDPWSDNADQPVMPWRGRITTIEAPGRFGSTDQTAAARTEVSAFFGSAQVSDFAVVDGAVVYSGPVEWSYRRFILHYAYLCQITGGIEAFNIGSEMRSLTQIRDGATTFPAVDALVQLAQDVRSVLGPDVKIGYAADWSEYFGYHPQNGSGDVFFHLDPLWAQSEVDYIGIDNYMPLSDWRDNLGHLDEGFGAIYAQDYLRSNVAGGEGFDWYYASAEDRDAQNRTPISDGAYGESWVFRYKDIVNWWSQPHYNRIGGVREAVPTSWLPESKPIYFTELGCPAVDKGTNQPNVFYDPKSSESHFPYYSNGSEDTFMQAQYLRAVYGHWQEAANNPTSSIYFGPMVDLSRSHVWAWDARPWPEFPNRLDVWSDGDNHARGHWLTGRFGDQSLAAIVSEICEISGLTDIDVSELYGNTAGFAMRATETARQSLQPLMMAFDFSAFEVDGVLKFHNRHEKVAFSAVEGDLVFSGGDTPVVGKTRQPEAETSGRVRVSFWDKSRDYQTGSAQFIMADDPSVSTSSVELPVVLNDGAARNIASRWLVDSEVARDELKLTFPPSVRHVTVGDVIKLADGSTDATYRVERIEEQGARTVEAVRIEQKTFKLKDVTTIQNFGSVVHAALPLHVRFLDLPLLRENQNPSAPFVAATAQPWPGGAAVYSATSDDGYVLDVVADQPTVFGVTVSDLPRGDIGLWSEKSFRVRISGGALQSRSALEVLNGANALAIGDDDGWEIMQFRDAVLEGDGSYTLSGFLRGQLGTEGVMADVWPAGASVVFLGDAMVQVNLSDADRGVERHYRVGPVGRPVSDGSFVHSIEAFKGVGLRPYAPVHLAVTDVGGNKTVNWVRRTRIDGDSWQGFEVPLGEGSESYLVRVIDGGSVLRETIVTTPVWTYLAADILADGVGVGATIEVAQISDRFGPGTFCSVVLAA
ncbi:MAG: glycoside hydrolase/phage tail family protein [Rhodobacteraceae bacterium]|nr:glycoside hydrolase/phage tail family protein [Paracoccaceae bacterium]